MSQIAASIGEFGFTNPVLIDGAGGLIAGHGRILAARKIGMDEIPAIVLDHLTDTQRQALVIADNKLALNAGWDNDLLQMELASLKDAGFDLDLTGFDGFELAGLLDKNPGNTDPDDTPDVQAVEIARPGDVWLLGRHRLVCGDSTDALVVEKALGGVSPHLMVTDPPYGVDYDPTFAELEAERGKG